MPKIAYQATRFHKGTLATIATANEIIEEYQDAGFTLAVRQLFYQFVVRALVENSERTYKNLSNVVSKARLAGLIDWDVIEDRTRWLRRTPHWESPAQMVAACADDFHVDMWAGQKWRPEVWIEKDALIGVIEGVCQAYDVPYFSCRGCVSQSEMWAAGHRRFRRYLDLGQQAPVIFHLGDHDPSGLDMTRDIRDRLAMFSGEVVPVIRLALNMDQVEAYSPPPNPAKMTDPRAPAYVADYGPASWELDALDPQVLADLIETNVRDLIEPSGWREAIEVRDAGRKRLAEIALEVGEVGGA